MDAATKRAARRTGLAAAVWMVFGIAIGFVLGLNVGQASSQAEAPALAQPAAAHDTLAPADPLVATGKDRSIYDHFHLY